MKKQQDINYLAARIWQEASHKYSGDESVKVIARILIETRSTAFEEAEQIALNYRDEADNGQHSDFTHPYHSLGQGYAANKIAKRINILKMKI